jgi:nicotinamide mononucleotide adenylyltransferase
MFIGRYQSPHKGHQAIFDTYLGKGLPVLIAIRDTKVDDVNPLTAYEVKKLWEKVYEKNPLVAVIVIPDIASVNYGRGVGYEVKEIEVTQNIANISATEIRRQIRNRQTDWKTFVDQSIWDSLEGYLRLDRLKFGGNKIV